VRVEAGAGEAVVLAVGDQVPAEHGHLARGRDGGDLEAAAFLDASVERAQRPCGASGAEGRFDEHAAGLGRAGLGDPAVCRRAVAGLADAGVEAEVGDESVGTVEPVEVADCGEDRDRDGDIDPGHGHQSRDDRVVERLQGDVAVDLGELLAVEVELPQKRLDAPPLIRGQVLPVKPALTDAGEEVGVRTGRDEVARHDRVHLVLHPGALLDQMSPSHD